MGLPAIDNLPPIHPGALLLDELEALGLAAEDFAVHIGEPTSAVTEIIDQRRGISGLMALKLGRVFGTTSQYWLNLQNMHDTKEALATHGHAIERVKPLPNIAVPMGLD